MERYLSAYGWHFSKAMAQWAISQMKDINGSKITMTDKATIETQMKANGIEVESQAYDIVYVYAMAKADYFGSSITSEMQLETFVKDYLNDEDGYDEKPFTRFYADCVAKGKPIIWSDML